jgi:undecaprenyl-diphosphatase
VTTLQALILGIVQGVAEFLPISSSGHLVVLQRVFGMEEPALTFDIVVHLGSLLAIVLAFWPKIWGLIKKPFCKMTGLLVVGTIPAVVAGFFMRGFIENYLRTGIWLAAAFTITGFLLLYVDKNTKAHKEEQDITYFDALFVGICQALALPPGISRSGTTIAGALGRGVKRTAAAEFSFMLAFIIIAAAGVLELIQILRGEVPTGNIGLAPMAIGFATSFIVGYFSIRLLLKLIKACKFKYFSYYVWCLAAFILLDTWLINRFF